MATSAHVTQFVPHAQNAAHAAEFMTGAIATGCEGANTPAFGKQAARQSLFTIQPVEDLDSSREAYQGSNQTVLAAFRSRTS
jgi:hypothetical protein